MAWTKEQQAAIDSRDQTLLLSAAAGSGKTAVLVERIIRRLLDKDKPVDITELLVVTFTKAAAAEMRERVAAALTQALAEDHDPAVEKQLALLPSAHISTLHAFCQSVIRRYFYTIDVDPRFTVGGEEELNLLRHSVMEEVFLSYYEDGDKAEFLYPLADMFGTDRGDDALMNTVGRIYNYSRAMPWPEAWLDEAAAAYAIPEEATIDDLSWTVPVLQHVRQVLSEQVKTYDTILHQLTGLADFQAAFSQLTEEREAIQRAEQCQSWSELEVAVTAISFKTLKAVRGLEEEDKAFWDGCKDQRSDVKKIIKAELQEGCFAVSAADWLDGIRAMQPVMAGLVQLTKDFAEAYRLAKKDKGWVDFNDLEHLCLKILLSPQSQPGHPVRSAAAEELSRTFKEVLIDEYQDTNGVQELITSLVSNDDNRFMVGDIKQSIYRFRLADPNLFLTKYSTFSRKETAKERCIDLARNFRSAENILAAVNEVFARSMTETAAGMGYGAREQLYAGRPACMDERWIGGPIEIHLLDTAPPLDQENGTAKDEQAPDDLQDEPDLTDFEQECLMVAKRLQDLKEEGRMVARKDGTLEPLQWRHMVILMRSMANKADAMLQALQSAGIPAYVEQSGGYFSAIEVRIILDLLRCIDNPEQDLAMAAVLRSPIVGMSEASLAQLRLSGPGTLWQNLPAYSHALPEGEERQVLLHYQLLLEQWRTYGRRNGVADLLQRIYEDTAYVQYVGGMPGGKVRQANLQALYDRARQYEESGFRGLLRYLKLIEKMREDQLDLAPAKVLGEGEDVVRVMSIHKSKGLEFPVVVLADMGKGFNLKDLRETILFHNRQGIGVKYYDAKWRMFYPTFIWNGIRAQLAWESKAEEQRILYVAMTRARDKLILTGHSSKLADNWQRWQRDIDPGSANCYLDWLMPVLVLRPDCRGCADAVAAGEDYQCDSGLWHIAVHHNALCFTAAEQQEADPRIGLLQERGLTGTAVPDWLEENLSWQYGYPLAIQTAAKLSVSEIKRRYGQLQTEELEEANQLAVSIDAAVPKEEDSFLAPPDWLQDKTEEHSGAQRGTVLHKVMQYVSLVADSTDASLRQELAQWETEGIFTAEERAMVYIPAVTAFCQSELGRRMAASSQVRREYPFSVLFSGGEYLPPVEAGETILIQGVIDCLFKEQDGWVLVDYKSDFLAEEQLFRDRYTVQLALYKRALEQILGETVKEVFIYSFHLNKAIGL